MGMARYPTIRALLRLFGGAAACLRVRLAEPASLRLPPSQEHSNGLDRAWRFRAFRCDLGALSLALAVILVGLTALPRQARADGAPPGTYAYAMERCVAWKDSGGQGTCGIKTLSTGDRVVCPIMPSGYCYSSNGLYPESEIGWVKWDFSGDTPTESACKQAPTGTGQFPGKILQDMVWCNTRVPASDGLGFVSCGQRFRPAGPPTQNRWGSWSTQGTLTSNGELCDGSGPGSSTNGWTGKDGQPAPAPVPPSPSSDPPKQPAPQLCGGGSCYDSSQDKFCAVLDGVQKCVSGATARAAAGGCTASGDKAVCAGSPTAPKPSSAVIPDPATQVKASDDYTQADPVTGAAQTVRVVTYGSGASKPSSGQQAGDTGPAPASSAGGDQGDKGDGNYSGGTDCDSPPACTGDAVLCGIGRQSWAQQCQIHKDLTDTSGLDGMDRSNGPENSPNEVFSQEQGDASGNPVDGLDGNGWLGGGGQCPARPIELMGKPLVDWGPMCDAIAQLRTFALAMAYVLGAIIIARSKA